MLFKIAWLQLWHKSFQTGLLILITLLAIALSVLVTSVGQGLQQGLIKATEPFTLLVGAKGSEYQLVLNSVFLQDRPIGNISGAELEKLTHNPLVKSAIPLGFGDNYRGFRIVGTTPDIFTVRVKPTSPEWLTLKEGRPFTAPYEAVIGIDVARKTGLAVGSTFASVHGISEKGKEHKEKEFTVVGILNSVEGPYDQAVLVSMDTIWAVHEHGNEIGNVATGKEVSEHKGEVTAIMVQPVGYGQAFKLAQQYQSSSKDAQLVFPAQTIVRLFAAMGQGEKLFLPVGITLIFLTLAVVILTSYLGSLNRLREHAVLRAIGATNRQIMKTVFYENAIVVLLGAVLGWLAGEGAYLALTHFMANSTAISMGTELQWLPATIAGSAAVLGILSGFIPAILIQRKDTKSYL